MAGGFFVSPIHVVKFELPVRESSTPSSEGSSGKHPATDANNWWGALFLGGCLRSLDCQLEEAGCFIG